MPKKAKKSVSQSTAKVKKHRLSNISSQNSTDENTNDEQHMETTTIDMPHFGMVTEDVIRNLAIMYQPGTSSLKHDMINLDSTIEPEPEKKSTKVFEDKLLSISKMERRTAKAFKEHGIEDQFEWPALNEDRFASLMRKHRNQAKLSSARQREFQNPNEEQLNQERHQMRAVYSRLNRNSVNENLAQEHQKTNAEKCRQYRNPDNPELRQQRREVHAEHCRIYRNPEDPQLSQERHELDAERCRSYRNPEDSQLRQQRHEVHAEHCRTYRNPEDPQLSQQRHEEHALRQYGYRISEQISRGRETPIQRRQRVQNALEARNDNRRATQIACKATEILNGEQLITEQNVGSFTTPTGAYENLCEHCKALRFPKERENICCQHGKVFLPKVPEPTPILKELLEGQNLRSKVFKKYIVPINNALALASNKANSLLEILIHRS